MDCSLAALIACFSWSGLYIDGDLSYLDADVPRREWFSQIVQLDWGTESIIQTRENTRPSNPYGRLAIGYQVEFRSVTFALEGWHMSSTVDGDRGFNAVSLRARWFPFR